MGMDSKLVICDGNGGQLDLLKTPFQHIKPWLHQASCNTRSVLAASSRTDLKDMPLFITLPTAQFCSDCPPKGVTGLSSFTAVEAPAL